MNNMRQIIGNVYGKLIGLSFIILSFSPVGAQTLGRYEAEFTLSDYNFVDTIPLQWERGQVFVPVSFDGRCYRFLLDTGAGMSVVFSGTPLANGQHVGDINSHDATGRTITVPMIELPPMRMGHITLTGCRATVQQHASGSNIDGILGFDIVNGGLNMKIDVPHRRLVISDRKGFFIKEDATVRMKYTLDFHVPYLDIVPFARHHERVLFDTGSRQFFVMNKQHFDEANDDADWSTVESVSGSAISTIQAIPTIPTVSTIPSEAIAATPAPSGKRRRAARYKAEPVPPIIEGRSFGCYAIGLGGLEPEGEVVFMLLNGLQMGGYSFSQVHALTSQGGSHIGAAVLEHGAVTFCSRPRLMLFQPVDETQPHPVGNRQVEIAFVADAMGRAQVGLVWEQGEPYKAGLRYGDVIEQIDHQPVLSLAHFVRWPFISGQAHLFTVRSKDGERRDIRWVRAL